MHDHPQCIAVNLTDLHVEITTPEGKNMERTMHANQIQWQPPLSHAVKNLSDHPLEVIFIELKAPVTGESNTR
jgi:hypothetical protein